MNAAGRNRVKAGSRITRRIFVTRVIDGDSMLVKYSGFWSFLRRSFEVRLYAIDAPEYRQAMGVEATRCLSGLVRGPLLMEEVAYDRYRRVVGLVYRLDQGRYESVNLMMVRAGMAYWYRRYGGAELGFARGEASAKGAGLGVWKRGGGQRPWDYRSEVRRRARSLFGILAPSGWKALVVGVVMLVAVILVSLAWLFWS